MPQSKHRRKGRARVVRRNQQALSGVVLGVTRECACGSEWRPSEDDATRWEMTEGPGCEQCKPGHPTHGWDSPLGMARAWGVWGDGSPQ